MKYFFLVTFVILFTIESAKGIIFSRCDLAKQLLIQGFPRNLLENWVCLVESESSRSTSVKGGPNTDGTYDWGLFQINDGYWCKPHYPGGDCHVACENLLTDNITAASKCARLIYKRHGFSAWYGWVKKCQGALPDLTPCGLIETNILNENANDISVLGLGTINRMF